MISERKALGARIHGDDCVIAFDGDALAPAIAHDVSLLLDVHGKLVGVDLGGEGFARVVIMIGAHETVVSQRAARASIASNELQITGGATLV